jgi:cell division protein FtsZ
MSEGGAALMAVGNAKGEDAAQIAAEQAISSQLLDITIDGAHGVLFNVTGGSGLTLYDVNQAAAIIKETAHPDVNLIFGAVIDPEMEDAVRITVIATGFERQTASRRLIDQPINEPIGKVQEQESEDTTQSVRPDIKNFQPRAYEIDDLDVPAFIRNSERFNQ